MSGAITQLIEAYEAVEASKDVSREQRVRDLIAHWQPRLGLQAWDIRYVDEPFPNKKDEQRLSACVYKEMHSKIAQIFLAENTPDEDLVGSVLHELLHITLSDLEEMAMAGAGLAGRGSMVFMDMLELRIERAIEDVIFALTGRRFVAKGVREKPMFSAFQDAA